MPDSISVSVYEVPCLALAPDYVENDFLIFTCAGNPNHRVYSFGVVTVRTARMCRYLHPANFHKWKSQLYLFDLIVMLRGVALSIRLTGPGPISQSSRNTSKMSSSTSVDLYNTLVSHMEFDHEYKCNLNIR